ncbi:MAG: HEAT repeat domain-containing protein [Elusimicrobiota bacterium]
MRVKYIILAGCLLLSISFKGWTEENNLTPRVQMLLERLYSSDRNRQMTAARELRDYNNKKVIDALKRIALNKDIDRRVRRVAVKSLGDIKNVSAISTLLSIMDQGEINLQIEAMGAAINFSTPTVREKIIEKAESNNPIVRQKAIFNLGKLTENGSVERIQQILQAKLKDVNAGVRKSAVQVIAKRGFKQLVPSLVELLKLEESEVVKVQLLNALGELKAVEGRETLKDFLSDSSPMVRVTAALSLAKMGIEAGLSEAISAIKSSDPQIKIKACRVMGLVGDEDVKVFLEQAVQDYDTRVKRAARRALNSVEKRINKK